MVLVHNTKRSLLLFCRPLLSRRRLFSSFASSGKDDSNNDLLLLDLLHKVRDGKLHPQMAIQQIRKQQVNYKGTSIVDDDDIVVLESFANVDYERYRRSGFPEAVLAQNKTSTQVAKILDSMAKRHTIKKNVNASANNSDGFISSCPPILATR